MDKTKEEKRRARDIKMLKALIIKIVFIGLCGFLLFGVILGIAPMKGGDMEPMLSAGDLLIYYRPAKDFTRNEIVIIEKEGSQYVGRLIGLPGDTLNITEGGTISINDNNIFESNIFYETLPYPDTGRYPITLKQDQYFLLADKRDTAKDSRYFGAVSRDEIKGKILTAVKRIN